MIDPISSIPLTWINQQDSIASHKSNKKNKTSDDEPISNTGTSTVIHDRIALSFDLKGDLEKLSQSVSTVQKEIRSQLESYFGILNPDDSEDNSATFLPPDDASAQELKDFYNPQNTANRIVEFATSFFDVYKNNHTTESEEENVTQFSTMIEDAVTKGFEEAQKVLGDLDKLDEIGKNIKHTFSLVMEGIDQFRHENFNKLGIEPDKIEFVGHEVNKDSQESSANQV